MFRLLGNKRLLILLFALIFFIAVMGLTKVKRESVTWPEMVISDTVSWMQSLLNKPAAYVAGLFEDIGNMRTLYEENKALKRTISFYARDVARLNLLEKENERLQEALAFTERQKKLNDYTYRIAHVVSRSTDALNSTVRIDLGSKDGIRENMPVMTSEGLIGRTIRVTPFHATVELLHNLETDDTSKAIAATVLGNEERSFGIIQSYDRSNKVLRMTKIKHEDPLVEGDIVITSGKGGVYPEGLVIGTVISRDAGILGTITHTADIKPAADFDPLNLREVFVVEVPEL